MAEKTEAKTEFPLNLEDAFRARAEPWLHAQLGAGNADYMMLREWMRSILVTMNIRAAEAFAVDLMQLLPYGQVHVVVVKFLPGMPDNWKYQCIVEGLNHGVYRAICSDHLCRIVTRMVETRPGVKLIDWPEEWPRPEYKKQAA